MKISTNSTTKIKSNLLECTKHIDPQWFTIWCTIYLSFILLDIFFPNFPGSTLLKYSGIFLCLVYAWKKYPKDHLLHLALLLTLLSDTILMWVHAEILGVYTFIFAQFFHTSRLAKTSQHFLLLYFFIVFLIFCFGLIQGIDPIYVTSFIYATGLITNLILSHQWYKKSPNNPPARAAAYGFLLFLACDISVATSYLTIGPVHTVVSFLVWIFYYPSQILISNSSTIKQ
jgi:hypothetical protein